MDFVGVNGNGVSSGSGGASGVSASLGSENGPILYTEPNRTSAIDDIRSVVIYIFIITIFLSFFLILPGIRYEKFPTFLCITTSLIVTSIIVVALFGTSWHVAEAPISAAYKAFSRDRIQGDLSVKIGLQSVNITLNAHKYYILHATHGPIIMDNSPIVAAAVAAATVTAKLTEEAATSSINHLHQSSSSSQQLQPQQSDSSLGPQSSNAKVFIHDNKQSNEGSDLVNNEETNSKSREPSNLAEELLGDRTSDGTSVDTELDAEEVFGGSSSGSFRQNQGTSQRRARSSSLSSSPTSAAATTTSTATSILAGMANKAVRTQRSTDTQEEPVSRSKISRQKNTSTSNQKYTLKRVNVDINYNERFYWIEPNQMSQEHQRALERGLPYPILTVVEYLSQDAAGFSWSRQYRSAGYYSSIILWLSLCVSALMFFLHCAAPKYGIYALQTIGLLLLTTNFTYAILVPRDEQKLVIPFENQTLTFKFGWNFWLVLIGGGLALLVGTLIVIIDSLFPNFVFTTILDFDFDSHNEYYMHRRKQNNTNSSSSTEANGTSNNQLTQHSGRPSRPPFFNKHNSTNSSSSTKSSNSLQHETSSTSSSSPSLSQSSTPVASPYQTSDAGHHKNSEQQHQNTQNKTTVNHHLNSRQIHSKFASDTSTTRQQQQQQTGKGLIRNRLNQHQSNQHSKSRSSSSSQGSSKHINPIKTEIISSRRSSIVHKSDTDDLDVRL